ncbi:MAG: ABC transporter permease [Saprospiraceae bacterium]|nr:ABC transporter permease [Saprospiraceae bacterium]
MSKITYLIELEWLKVKTYRPFLVLLGLYALLLPAFMYSAKKMPIPKEIGGTQTLFMFPNVWLYLGYVGNWLVFFLMGFLAVQAISNETFNRTLRQNIISGLSRTEFFFSKFSFLTLINLAATVYYALWALIFGFTNTETVYASKVYENIDTIFRYFLMCMGYSSLGLFLGVLFSRSILGLFVYFSYIMFIEKIIRYVLIRKILGSKAMLFAPSNAFNDLVPPPVPKILNQTIEGTDIRLFLYPNEAIITTIIYASLFFYGAYYLLKTRDL